jgi:ribosomal protein S18 acetylase RimI-like enzyme
VTPVLIRPARVDDLEALAELHHAIWLASHAGFVGLPTSARDIGWYRDVIAPTLERTIVAERAGTPVGYVTWLGDLLDDIWIAPWAQGQGIGARLLGAGEEAIHSSGHDEARLECVAGNLSARRFYERHGWTFLREFATHSPRPGLVMAEYRKRLSGGDGA